MYNSLFSCEKYPKYKIQNFFLTKGLTNPYLCIIFRFVKGSDSINQMPSICWGPGFSDSLLHSLSSGLWAQTQFRMPISFSPFLPFKASEKNAAGNSGVFLFMYNSLFFKYAEYFPMLCTNKLIHRNRDCHFIPTAFQLFSITNKTGWITRNINYFFYI